MDSAFQGKVSSSWRTNQSNLAHASRSSLWKLTHMRRHLRGPRSFEMLAQNRPVYVQQVESRAPPYAVSHGRHVVIVD